MSMYGPGECAYRRVSQRQEFLFYLSVKPQDMPPSQNCKKDGRYRLAVLDQEQIHKHARGMTSKTLLDIIFSADPHTLKDAVLVKKDNLAPGKKYLFNFKADMTMKGGSALALPLSILFCSEDDLDHPQLLLFESSSQIVSGDPPICDSLSLPQINGSSLVVNKRGLFSESS